MSIRMCLRALVSAAFAIVLIAGQSDKAWAAAVLLDSKEIARREEAKQADRAAREAELKTLLDSLSTAPTIGSNAGSNGQKRVALVVGNNDYAELKDLDKAVGDAGTIADALEGLGFTVTMLENMNVDDFDVALSAFYESIGEGDIAFFFYAGHGIAAEGVNYLLPVDMPEIKPSEVRRVERNAIDATRIVSEITARGAQLAFVVLDACRDDPFPQHDTRGASRLGGLARMTPDPGAFVIYSAGTGQTALDRLSPQDEDPNSIFTRKFHSILTTPGMPIVEIAKRTQVEVKALADRVRHDQAPAYYDQVIGQFYFRNPEPKLYGLVIGIDEYNRAQQLRGAVNDARWVAGALRDAGAADVIEITDRDARPQFIEFAWKRLVDQAKPGDTIVFSYAGASSHENVEGKPEEPDGRDEYLALADFDWNVLHQAGERPEASAVLYDDVLTGWMEKAAAKNLNVILVVDGCYGGGLLDREFANVSFIGGSAEDEVVLEYEVAGEYHGIVSALFSDAIDGAADRNSDGFVSQKELFAHIQARTFDYVGFDQTPQFFPAVESSSTDLALFRIGSAKAPKE
ncbi:caspase family protein [Mesorhizobium sp. Z1-4]|uniref:caspase family protein n=1 Tax=Mesorhizobium sp. Z1-4 TaxID=2448478 RepID=UPI0013DF0602|nr:caspase family protein [Mesorhizobium sp. Z1-4]